MSIRFLERLGVAAQRFNRARQRVFGRRKTRPSDAELAEKLAIARPNRATRRYIATHDPARRRQRRAAFNAIRRLWQVSAMDDVEHCGVSNCRRLPRYEGRCYGHQHYDMVAR
jgi:hypothetical protein